MAKTKKEMLDDILTGLLQVGQIKACGIVSSEGQIIDSRAPSDVDEGNIFTIMFNYYGSCRSSFRAAQDRS